MHSKNYLTARFASTGICAYVFCAAYGKLFYPSTAFKTLDVSVGLAELTLIALLLYLYKKPQMWLIMGCVAASWGGYAFFWHDQDLPCGCLGRLIQIPGGFSLSIDLLFFLTSLGVAFRLEERKQTLLLAAGIACLFAAAGFSFGEYMFSQAMNLIF